MSRSDGPYSLLYQHKIMVELLLRSWAPADVAEHIDYETLRAESPKNYDDDGRLRTGDHIWTVRLKRGGLVWIAILMEFQASADRLIPWRVLSYATTFWRRVESTGRLQDGKLPGVLPVVIYNGPRPWNVPQDLSECVNLPEGSPLWTHVPRVGYLLVDVLRQDASRLEALDNPVAWAMLLEQAREPGQAGGLAAKMDAWANAPERRAIWEAFGVLMRELVTAGRVQGQGLKYQPMGLKLTEQERSMSLAENFDRWKEQWFDEGAERGRQEGEQRGLERGRQEGRQEGEQLGLNRGRREAVQIALELKFGDLGLRFWSDHLAKQDIAPWGEILSAVKQARSIDELHRFRARA